MQKKWTVVIEITDLMDIAEGNDESLRLTRGSIESLFSDVLAGELPNAQYQIMEIIDAPYGPQGVSIQETPRFRTAQVCICAAGSRYANPNCRAKVHKP